MEADLFARLASFQVVLAANCALMPRLPICSSFWRGLSAPYEFEEISNVCFRHITDTPAILPIRLLFGIHDAEEP